MTAAPPSRHGILDRPDRTFPLVLTPTVPAIRDLARQSRRAAWDPETAIPWHMVDPSRYTADQLAAGQLYWSRRGWSEYGAISESPALQLRYALEQREPDLSLYWAARTQEEVRHAEVCARFARELGRYHYSPSAEELAVQAASLSTRDRVLDAGCSLESILAGLVCVAETVVYDVFIQLVRAVTDPVAKQILRLILRDEVRHCEFGWEYLAHRMPDMSADGVENCREAMISMIQDVELAGYRSAWLAESPKPGEVELDATVFVAGLGGSTAEWEAPILIKSIQGVRHRAASIGIELPIFEHFLLGKI